MPSQVSIHQIQDPEVLIDQLPIQDLKPVLQSIHKTLYGTYHTVNILTSSPNPTNQDASPNTDEVSSNANPDKESHDATDIEPIIACLNDAIDKVFKKIPDHITELTEYLNIFFRNTFHLCEILQPRPTQQKNAISYYFDTLFKRAVLIRHHDLLDFIHFRHFSKTGNRLFLYCETTKDWQPNERKLWYEEIITFTHAKKDIVNIHSLGQFYRKLQMATALFMQLNSNLILAKPQKEHTQPADSPSTPTTNFTDSNSPYLSHSTMSPEYKSTEINLTTYLKNIYTEPACYEDQEASETFNTQCKGLIDTLCTQIESINHSNPSFIRLQATQASGSRSKIWKKLEVFCDNLCNRYAGKRKESIEYFGYSEVKKTLEEVSYRLAHHNWKNKPHNVASILSFIDECDKCAEGMLDRLCALRSLYEKSPFSETLYQFRYHKSLELIQKRANLRLHPALIGSETHIYHSLLAQVFPLDKPLNHYINAWEVAMDYPQKDSVIQFTKKYTSINHLFTFMWSHYLEQFQTLTHPTLYSQERYDTDTRTLNEIRTDDSKQITLENYLTIQEAPTFFASSHISPHGEDISTKIAILLQLTPGLLTSILTTPLQNLITHPHTRLFSESYPCPTSQQEPLELLKQSQKLIEWLEEKETHQFQVLEKYAITVDSILTQIPTYDTKNPGLENLLQITKNVIHEYLISIKPQSIRTTPILDTTHPWTVSGKQAFLNLDQSFILVPDKNNHVDIAKKLLYRMYKDSSLNLGLKKAEYQNLLHLIILCHEKALTCEVPFSFILRQLFPWQAENQDYPLHLIASLNAFKTLKKWKKINPIRRKHFVQDQEKNPSLICILAQPKVYQLITNLYTETQISTSIISKFINHIATYSNLENQNMLLDEEITHCIEWLATLEPKDYVDTIANVWTTRICIEQYIKTISTDSKSERVKAFWKSKIPPLQQQPKKKIRKDLTPLTKNQILLYLAPHIPTSDYQAWLEPHRHSPQSQNPFWINYIWTDQPLQDINTLASICAYITNNHQDLVTHIHNKEPLRQCLSGFLNNTHVKDQKTFAQTQAMLKLLYTFHQYPNIKIRNSISEPTSTSYTKQVDHQKKSPILCGLMASTYLPKNTDTTTWSNPTYSKWITTCFQVIEPEELQEHIASASKLIHIHQVALWALASLSNPAYHPIESRSFILTEDIEDIVRQKIQQIGRHTLGPTATEDSSHQLENLKKVGYAIINLTQDLFDHKPLSRESILNIEPNYEESNIDNFIRDRELQEQKRKASADFQTYPTKKTKY